MHCYCERDPDASSAAYGTALIDTDDLHGGGSPPAPVLVGRSDERTVLRELLGRAMAGQGSFAHIGGEAGIGRTILTEALLANRATADAYLDSTLATGLTGHPSFISFHLRHVDLLAELSQINGIRPPVPA